MTEVSVLFELGSSRRELHEERDHLVYVIERELANVGKNGILAYFSCERGHQSLTKDVYILQRWALKWETYVDVTDLEQIKDGDRLTVIRQEQSQEDRATSSSSSAGFDTSQGQNLTKTAISVCQSLNNVSSSVTEKMKALFPSTAFSGGIKRSADFDPTRESDVMVNKRKKKKAVRIKPVTLNVMVVGRFASFVPRGGIHKNKSKAEQIKQKVMITKAMTSLEVKYAISSAFQHLEISEYDLLQSDRGGRLTLTKDQSPNGATLADGIIKRKAVLYIRPKSVEEESEEDDGFPDAGGMLGRTDSEPINISSDEHNDLTLPPVVPPSSLEEFRCIRAEQDAEYERMLAFDSTPVLAEEVPDETNQVDDNQDVTEGKNHLKDLLNDTLNFDADGYPVRIRFPGESSANLRCRFGTDVTTKNLYQYAFAFSNTERKFLIYTLSPRRVVPCCDQTQLSNGQFGATFAVEEDEDNGIDPEVLFIPTSSTYSTEEDGHYGQNSMSEFHKESRPNNCEDQESLLDDHQENDDANTLVDLDPKAYLEMSYQKRQQFINEKCSRKPEFPHIINRKSVFNDVNNLFEEDGILNEYPLRIKFNNEKAFDCGGVCRDMFSAYWEEAYSQFFDGSALLTPVLHPGVDMSVLPSLGTVLSHGYLVCGFIPTRIAFPVLASIFLGSEVKIPKRILIESFAECLSSIEAGVVKNALISTDKDFSPETKANLISILSQYGCRVCPTPGTLLLQLANTAHFEFQIKPLAVSRTIANGIPLDEKAFWESYSVEQLYSLYFALNATPQRILSVIEEPEVENESQARVFIYLKKFIGNMKSEELRRFLRFVTGTSVLLPEGIIICFNSNSGLMRRPIVHTCSCSLELPTTYVSYLDFEHEFHTILSSDDEYTWMMDAV